MAKWYEGAEEAAFKPVAGGYVFQPPSLFWPFVRPRCYLVNDAQKAELFACLRRQRRRIFLLVIVYVFGLGLTAAIGLSVGGQRMSPVGFIAVLIVTALAVVLITIVPHIYLMRVLRPVIADLPSTDERITFGDQLHSLAAAISGKLLLLGGVGGGMMIIGNVVSIVDTIAEDRGGPRLFWPIFGLVFGALLTSYFAYLAILKRKLKRASD